MEGTYMRPNERIPISISFCGLWMCRSYTIHVGKMRTKLSVMTAIEAKAVVVLPKLMHFAFGYAVGFQTAARGKH